MSKSNISSNIEKSRNTSEQFDWYKRREDVLRKIDVMDVADNFSVFATRQQITRFIETYRYWELIKNIPGNILECGVAGGGFYFQWLIFARYTNHIIILEIVLDLILSMVLRHFLNKTRAQMPSI